jgi:hypothetical protein
MTFDDLTSGEAIAVVIAIFIAFLMGCYLGQANPISKWAWGEDLLGVGYAKSVCEANGQVLDKISASEASKLADPIIICKDRITEQKHIDGQNYRLELN